MDVVGAEHRPRELLNQVVLLAGAARRGYECQRLHAVALLHLAQPGGRALESFLPAGFAQGAIAGADQGSYPSNNFFAATMSDVGFVDFAGGDYTLESSSPYAGAASDSRDLGADIPAVLAATAGVAP